MPFVPARIAPSAVTDPEQFRRWGGPGIELAREPDSVVYPNEETYYQQLEQVGADGYPPILDKLKAAALERGPDLTGLVSYDQRLIGAAVATGAEVVTPTSE